MSERAFFDALLGVERVLAAPAPASSGVGLKRKWCGSRSRRASQSIMCTSSSVIAGHATCARTQRPAHSAHNGNAPTGRTLLADRLRVLTQWSRTGEQRLCSREERGGKAYPREADARYAGAQHVAEQRGERVRRRVVRVEVRMLPVRHLRASQATSRLVS